MSKKGKSHTQAATEPIPLEDQIDRLEAQARELGVDTETLETPDFDDAAPELRLAFWTDVVAFEQAEPVAPFDLLLESGVSLPDPSQLETVAPGTAAENPAENAAESDTEVVDLEQLLWQVIHGLAFLGTYLHHTDHLSDRELYEHLWYDALREETVLMPGNPNFGYHLDLTGSGSDEDVRLQLRYYADEQERQQWLEQHPDYPMPESISPPFDRDRFLPEQALASFETEEAS